AARAEIVRTVVDRVVHSPADALLALNDAAYHETKRLEGSRKAKDIRELGEWQKLARSLARMDDGARRRRLEDLVETYAWDVAGNFNPRVFKMSTRLLPSIVTALLSPKKLGTLFQHPANLVNLEHL